MIAFDRLMVYGSARLSGFTDVIVPPNKVKTPGACVILAATTSGCGGMGSVSNVDNEHPETPEHGSAVASVRSKLVT